MDVRRVTGREALNDRGALTAPRIESSFSQFIGRPLAEIQALRARFHHHDITRPELAGQNPSGQRIFQFLLNRPLERPRAVNRIEASLAKLIQCRRGDLQPHLPVSQSLAQITDLNVRNRPNLLLAQRMEHHDFVDAVDELGPEMIGHLGHHHALHQRVVVR